MKTAESKIPTPHPGNNLFSSATGRLLPGGSVSHVEAIERTIQEGGLWVEAVRHEIGRVIVGQTALVDRLLVALLAGGHVLLEGVPGLAKTLSLKTLARAIGAHLPADPVHARHAAGRHRRHAGLQPAARDASRRRGDRSSRTSSSPTRSTARPPRCRARCSRRCRSGRSRSATRPMRCPSPFLVMATQNPIEQEGTYPLPEAQLDRFLLKVNVGYPTPDEELRILDAMSTSAPRLDVRPVVSSDEILAARQLVDAIYVDERVKRYIVSLVVATREPQGFGLDLGGLIRYGASPRATIGITLAAKAWAFLHGRGYVTPQDVKAVAPDVLRHRVAVTYEAEAEQVDRRGDRQRRILDHVAIP